MIELSFQATQSTMTEAHFLAECEGMGYKHLKREYYNTTVTEIPEELLQRALESTDFAHTKELILEESDGRLLVAMGEGWVRVLYFGEDPKAAKEHLARFRDLIPEARPEKNTAPFTFWSLGKDGPHGVYKELTVPTFEEIQSNYPSVVRNELEKLVSLTEGTEFGRLVLWRGEPGTGKTYALRSLARSWRRWCDFHYITDPEAFFGQAHYMMTVMTSQTSNDKWNLLILEDSGELLAPDAKQTTGQGLSRLLNLVDGILGQGLKLMVLVTTNEELHTMHPAVTRSGRCSSNLEFLAFDYSESNEWWEEQGSEVRRHSGHFTLANMYALLRGDEIDNDRKALVGFA